MTNRDHTSFQAPLKKAFQAEEILQEIYFFCANYVYPQEKL